MDDHERNELRRYANMLQSRGHAGEFATETSADRRIMELSTAREWADSFEEQYGISVKDIRANEDDPPDCVGTLNGRQIGVELTELVNPQILSAIAAARKSGRRITSHDELFDLAQWRQEQFAERLREIVDSKRIAYQSRDIFIDYLVVHTGEPWLNPHLVNDWLDSISVQVGPSIGSVHLLMTYFPGYADGWPLFEISS